MIDKDYIEEIRTLPTREAKDNLAEYAATLGATLKRTKSFENMVTDLEEYIKTAAAEPMPENNTGLLISDLIGEDEFIRDSVQDPKITVADIKEDFVKSIGNEDVPEITEELKQKFEKNGLKVVTGEELSGNTIEEAITEIIKAEKEVLPVQYHPKIALLGRAPGYYTLPWWIYQWVKDNEDWKERPTDFPHPTAHSTLFDLIFYINKYGRVIVRETRNSSFVTLT